MFNWCGLKNVWVCAHILRIVTLMYTQAISATDWLLALLGVSWAATLSVVAQIQGCHCNLYLAAHHCMFRQSSCLTLVHYLVTGHLAWLWQKKWHLFKGNKSLCAWKLFKTRLPLNFFCTFDCSLKIWGHGLFPPLSPLFYFQNKNESLKLPPLGFFFLSHMTSLQVWKLLLCIIWTAMAGSSWSLNQLHFTDLSAQNAFLFSRGCFNSVHLFYLDIQCLGGCQWHNRQNSPCVMYHIGYSLRGRVI